MKDGAYGIELILDIHECDVSQFNRKSIKQFLKHLCVIIDMKREKLHFWDDKWTPGPWKETEPHLVGTSVVQFIKTSNITMHLLDLQKAIRFNLFTCKDFVPEHAESFILHWFGGKVVNRHVIDRF